MLQSYGHGTRIPCAECGRKIYITEDVEVVERDGKRWVELTCTAAGCPAYGKPRLYEEGALEIRGTTGTATAAAG
jgi:hypothetical protein